MKKYKFGLLFTAILLISIILAISGIVLPAMGAPGNGTGISVKNVAGAGAAPSTHWSYTITELNPPSGSKPFTTTFSLPASGGGLRSITGLKAGSYSVTETPKAEYRTDVLIQSTKTSQVVSSQSWSITITLVSSEFKIITFTNSKIQPGVTVTNLLSGIVPSSSWNYIITPKATGVSSSFSIPAVGGSYYLNGLTSGAYTISETQKFGYYSTITSSGGTSTISGASIDVEFDSADFVYVVFSTAPMPAFTVSSVITAPPNDLGYTIPSLKPIPVQATWPVDINGDTIVDLVVGKPTSVFVNFAGLSFLSNDQISISVVFQGTTYTKTVVGSVLNSNSIVSFDPVAPTLGIDIPITGSYSTNGGSPINLASTPITVKDTIVLPLYYVPLSSAKIGYGSVSSSALSLMSTSSSDFIRATYPVKSLTTGISTTSIAGASPGGNRNPYQGMLTDAMAAAQKAQLAMGGSAIGIAVGPNNTVNTDYFTKQGFPGAAGISFGPNVKGVVVLDGYYTAPAHEVAHTFNLYYGVPEEYVLYPSAGSSASGVWVKSGGSDWRSGYDFMGLAPYKTTQFTWINPDTYTKLFKQTRLTQVDPDVVLASGIIHDDGTIDTSSLTWYHMSGIPDTVKSGNYALRFVDSDGNKVAGTTDLSFDAQFYAAIGQSAAVGSDISNQPTGLVTSNDAPFAFVTDYPTGTYAVQIIDNTKSPPVVMATVKPSDIVNGPTSSCSLSGELGSNNWYLSDVGVNIKATASPLVGIKEVHYILNGGTETIATGDLASFPVTTAGINTLEYWSVDNAGAVEAHQTITIKIDKSAPSVSVTSPANNAWLNSPLTIQIAASDASSGVSNVKVKFDDIDSTAIQIAPNLWECVISGIAEGKYTLIATATDEAGYSTTSPSIDFTVDDTAPVVSITSPTAGFYKTTSLPSLAYSVTDNLDLSPIVVVDGWSTTEGVHTVTVTATDATGNSASAFVTFTVDDTAPVVSITSPTTGTTLTWGSFDVTGISSDSGSGLKNIQIKVDDGTYVDAIGITSWSFAVSSLSDGTHIIYAKAIDNAGNFAETSITVTIDKTYIFTGFSSPVPGDQYNIGRTVPVKFQLKDPQGNYITTAIAKIYLAKVIGNVLGADQEGYEKGGTTNTITCSPGSTQYVFNLDTSKLSEGTWQIKVELDDGTQHTVDIGLR